MPFPVEKIRADFPVLNQQVHDKPLVYLDNAATTQKPVQVINRLSDYYLKENSNVHRGVHLLSQKATEDYEKARTTIAQYINAADSKEIIFTRGTTESVNLLATVLEEWIQPGDAILVSAMEHHSNLVPWQQLCKRRNADLKIVPVNDKGELDLEFLKKKLNPQVKLVAVNHISNVLGTINPVKEIVKMAHDAGVPVLIDGAQALAHTKVDVQEIGADFYAFSGHKVYAPMGIGVLYGRETWMRRLPPYQFGGEMIDRVSFDEVTFNELPYKYEAGTPNVGGALALESALQYVQNLGIEAIRKHEDVLLEKATHQLMKINGMRIIGEAKDKTAVLSFLVDGVHPYDLGTLLDQMGVAVRTGYHCAEPLMQHMGISGTVRASFALYNTEQEVDIFTESVLKAVNMLR
ncbi:MAG: cysteine desulfurase [Bacteroidales bacterium]|nr:cysteine desulfurase [Bacteroidales bacterium]